MSIDWNLQILRLNLHIHGPTRFFHFNFLLWGRGVGFFFRMRPERGEGEHGMPFKLFVRGRSLTL